MDIQTISVGNYTRKYESGISAMIDTGSTLVFLPRDIINHVFRGVKGLRRDFSGQYIVPCKSKTLPDIVLSMNNNTYTMKPEHYVITSGAVKF